MKVELISLEKEYEKNPDIKKEDIAQLSEWLKRQPHLPKLSELDLIIFYHSCYGSMETTKKIIDMNLTIRSQWTDFFDDFDPQSPKNAITLQTFLFTILPGATEDGYKIFFARLINNDPANFFMENAIKTILMINDLYQKEQGTCPGIIVVLDLEGIVLGHVKRLNLISMKRILHYLQEVMPVRLKGFHFINSPPFMDKILAFMKPFMKRSLSDLLNIHSSPNDSFFKLVPKENFPKEIGNRNEMKSFNEYRCDVQKWLQNNRGYLIERSKLNVDESKRQERSKYVGDIHGSFKKLDID